MESTFSTHLIDASLDAAVSVFAVDVDGDAGMDAVSASPLLDQVAWHKDGVRSIVSSSADGAVSVSAIDVDGDTDVDLLSASKFDSKVAWYEVGGVTKTSPSSL